MENVENETEDDVSLSQMSSFSLNLSQNTLNQILVAGASGLVSLSYRSDNREGEGRRNVMS